MKSIFAQILQNTERTNRNALMRKAFLANRIAKTVKGQSRSSSYAVKTKVINAMIEKFPNDISIVEDENHPQMVVVNVVNTRFGLHVPLKAVEAFN